MIKLLELFAGYGGASFALKKAKIDFECVGFSEIKKIDLAGDGWDINLVSKIFQRVLKNDY